MAIPETIELTPRKRRFALAIALTRPIRPALNTTSFDVLKLSPDELATLQRLREKMRVVEAAEVVTVEPTHIHEPPFTKNCI